jgi:hypothetical protein
MRRVEDDQVHREMETGRRDDRTMVSARHAAERFENRRGEGERECAERRRDNQRSRLTCMHPPYPSPGRGGFDEFRGGSGRGGGGRYQSASGGQDRKIMKRKAIDFHVPIMKAQEERMMVRNFRDKPTLEPTADSLRSLPAMLEDVSHNPALGICSKYIGLAVNKLRAPITAMAWAPDGRRIYTGAHTGEFTWWSVTCEFSRCGVALLPLSASLAHTSHLASPLPSFSQERSAIQLRRHRSTSSRRSYPCDDVDE